MPVVTKMPLGGMDDVQVWVDKLPNGNGNVSNQSMMTKHTLGYEDGDSKQTCDTNGEEIATSGVGGLPEKMKKTLLLKQQDSFNSESSHQSNDSLERILISRRPDPEKILINLGFQGKVVDKRRRIPERFLLIPSKAEGISTEKFLDENPEMKEYLEEKAAFQRPLDVIAQDTNDKQTTDVVSPTTPKIRTSRPSFQVVVSTVQAINHFKSVVRKVEGTEEESVPIVEPILRENKKGQSYWSILAPDNSSFLERMEFYDTNRSPNNTCRLANVACKLTRKSVTVSKQLLEREEEGGGELNDVLRGKGSCLERQSRSSFVDESSEIPRNVPQRFRISHSMLYGPNETMDGQTVAQIVASERRLSMVDVNCNKLSSDATIPTIVINNRSVEYEWQSTSVSSYTTEEEEEEEDFDINTLFPSNNDNASDASSLTIQDNDTDALSDTNTDILQFSQDSESLSRLTKVDIRENERTIYFDVDAPDSNKSAASNVNSDVKRRMRNKDWKHLGSSTESSSSGIGEEHEGNDNEQSTIKYTNRQRELDVSSSSSFADSQHELTKNFVKVDESNNEKHSIETQTRISFQDFISEVRCDDEAANFVERFDLISVKEKFVYQPTTYTTRLYIDSLMTKASIPVNKQSEIILLIDANVTSNVDETIILNDNEISSTVFSSVDIKLEKTEEGHEAVTPFVFRFGETLATENLQQYQEHDRRRLRDKVDLFLDDEMLLERNQRRLSANINRRNCSPDLTNHQILHSFLRQSVFISPQSAANLLPPTHWLSGHSYVKDQQGYLVEEVKLLQHALQKYKLEMRVLHMQADKLYKDESLQSLPEESNLKSIEELHEMIVKEMNSLDELLSQRMKFVISNDYDSDVEISCISVVHQMTELLKEQLYQSNIINSMSTILQPPSHMISSSSSVSPLDLEMTLKSKSSEMMFERLASLEQKMDEQSKMMEMFLNGAFKQMQKEMNHLPSSPSDIIP